MLRTENFEKNKQNKTKTNLKQNKHKEICKTGLGVLRKQLQMGSYKTEMVACSVKRVSERQGGK